MSDNNLKKKNGLTKPSRSNEATKSFEWDYDVNRERYEFKILDPDLYPIWLVDPEAGCYEIKKTKNGRLQMTK